MDYIIHLGHHRDDTRQEHRFYVSGQLAEHQQQILTFMVAWYAVKLGVEIADDNLIRTQIVLVWRLFIQFFGEFPYPLDRSLAQHAILYQVFAKVFQGRRIVMWPGGGLELSDGGVEVKCEAAVVGEVLDSVQLLKEPFEFPMCATVLHGVHSPAESPEPLYQGIVHISPPGSFRILSILLHRRILGDYTIKPRGWELMEVRRRRAMAKFLRQIFCHNMKRMGLVPI
ncbi:MAG: hypothetical protein MJ240_02015 [Kiritimatiellae bacterium]|nr:hypothetical protein [Kiritimatiellia bacterium]